MVRLKKEHKFVISKMEAGYALSEMDINPPLIIFDKGFILKRGGVVYEVMTSTVNTLIEKHRIKKNGGCFELVSK